MVHTHSTTKVMDTLKNKSKKMNDFHEFLQEEKNNPDSEVFGYFTDSHFVLPLNDGMRVRPF